MLYDAIVGTPFEGISGWLNISTGSRIGLPYSVLQLQPGWHKTYSVNVTMEPIGEYNSGMDHIDITGTLRFADGTATPPRDAPEKCAPGSEYAGRKKGCVVCLPGSYNPGWDGRCFRCAAGTAAQG